MGGVRYLFPKDLPAKLNLGMTSCKQLVATPGFPAKVSVPGVRRKAWIEEDVDKFLRSYADGDDHAAA